MPLLQPLQQQQGQGHEGDEGHVVGDQHGGQKAEQGQEQRQGLDVAGPGGKPAGGHHKHPRPRQAGHRRHQAEQDAKGAKIDILKIRRRRGRKARGNQREERRDQEHRLPFHKTKQPLFQPAFTGSFGLQTSIQPWEFDSFSSSSQVRRMAELALPQAG